MVFRIKVLPLAEFEINDSISFYENQKLGLGKQFLSYLKGYFKILITNPKLFAIKNEPYFRELPLVKFPFVIIFEIYQDEVIIHSVFHTSRNHTKKPK